MAVVLVFRPWGCLVNHALSRTAAGAEAHYSPPAGVRVSSP